MKQKLFGAKIDNRIKLVDNWDYINWASTEPNPSLEDTFGPGGILTNDVFFESHWAAKYFLEQLGAGPLNTSDKLFYAVTAMFHWRADLGLEAAKYYRNLDSIEYAFGDLSTCTERTREYGEKLQGFISGGCCRDFEDKEWFMNATVHWLTSHPYNDLKS